MATDVRGLHPSGRSASAERGQTCAYERTHDWSALIDCDDEARVHHMADRYLEIASLPDQETRVARLAEIVVEELSGDDATLRSYTASRLRAWAALGAANPEALRTLATDADSAYARLPGGHEFRRAMAVQAVFEATLSPRQQEVILELAPGFGRYVSLRRASFAPPAPPAKAKARGDGGWWDRFLRRFGRAPESLDKAR